MKKTFYIFLMLFAMYGCASTPTDGPKGSIKKISASAKLKEVPMKNKYRTGALKKYKTAMGFLNFDKSKSKENFLKAIEVDPNFCEAYFNIGLIELESNNLNEALSWIDKSLEANCRHSVVYSTKGLIHLKNNDHKKAAAEFKNAVLYDETAAALTNLASVYYILKDFDTSLKHYKEALVIEPHNPQVLYNTALVSIELEDFKNAEIYLSRALKNNKDFTQAKSLYAEVMIYNGQIDEALSYLKKESSKDRENPDYHKNMGIIMELYKNDYKTALHHYEIYIKLRGRNSEEVKNWIAIVKAKSSR